MRKFVSYVIVFVLGFAACAFIFKSVFGTPGPGTLGVPLGPTITGTRNAPPIARTGNNPVAVAAAKVEQSVVNIDTEGRPTGSLGFPDFFGFGPPQEAIPKGQASGVIIRPDGYILTNNHVVANTQRVAVTLSTGKKYPAEIVGRDPKTDLAVIKIAAKGLPAATFIENSSDLRVGDWVIAVGNALGLGTTVTVGVISATERTQRIEGTDLENAIQTDAAINRGNSGGALADINGNIVGINTAIASTNPGGGSIGIGFAIPSNTARWVADQIVKRGKVIRPWIGIGYRVLNDELRQELAAQGGGRIPNIDGAIVLEVAPNSPADRAGLLPLDIITEINGKKVKSERIIAGEVTKGKVGDIVDLTVWRARTQQHTKIAIRTVQMPGGA